VKRPSIAVFCIACALATVLSAFAAAAGQAKAKAILAKLGAKVEADAAGDIVGVTVHNQKVTDDDLKCLKDLPKLKSLDLSHTDIQNAGLVHLGGLQSLEKLDLSFTKATDAGLAHLKGLSRLKWLNLEKPCKGMYDAEHRFTDKALPHLKGLKTLEYLNIDWNMVTDDGLEQLHGLTNLRELVLGFQTDVKGPGVEKLRKALPGAKIH
jgi:hypothetical protein